MTPTLRVSSAPSGWISKSEPLSWMEKPSNCKSWVFRLNMWRLCIWSVLDNVVHVHSGTPLDRRDSAPLRPVTTEELTGSLLSMMSRTRYFHNRIFHASRSTKTHTWNHVKVNAFEMFHVCASGILQQCETVAEGNRSLCKRECQQTPCREQVWSHDKKSCRLHNSEGNKASSLD